MNRKRFMFVVIVVLLISALLWGCSNQAAAVDDEPAENVGTTSEEVEEADVEEEAEAPAEDDAEDPLRAAFVLHGTIDDGNWNNMAHEGMKIIEENGWEVTYTENVVDADVARVLRNFAEEGYDLIWAHSGTYPNAVIEVAPDYPDVTFASITGPGLDFPDNVWQVAHEWEDAYFLAGAMAGLMTETNIIGQAGGIPIPIYAASMIAYNQGAQYANPEVEPLEPVFIGDFNDSAGAKQATAAMIEQGADIICSSMDAGIYGMIEAAREANEAGADVKIMSILSAQHENAPDVVLNSALMEYTEAVVAVADLVADGEKGGYYRMSWADGNARWADFFDQVPQDVIDRLAEIEQEIMAGEIDVYTQADLFAEAEE